MSSVPLNRIGSHLPPRTRKYLPFDPREEMFARSPHCRYCGREFKRVSRSTADHVIPVAKGGETILSNLTLACRTCNNAKGDRTPLELVGWALRVLFVAFITRMTGGAA